MTPGRLLLSFEGRTGCFVGLVGACYILSNLNQQLGRTVEGNRNTGPSTRAVQQVGGFYWKPVHLRHGPPPKATEHIGVTAYRPSFLFPLEGVFRLAGN